MASQIDELRETCSQCKSGVVSKPRGSYPRWCKECLAKYKRENLTLKLDREGRRGFIQGARGMRQALVDEFARLGMHSFSGDEIAQLIANAPGPLIGLEEEEAAQAS